MALKQIREALADSLSGVPGLSEGEGYVRFNATPPFVDIEPGPIDYDQAFARGLDEYTITVRVEVPFSTDIGSQRTLDRLMEPSGEYSIKAAIEADDTLAGACEDLRVTKCSGYRSYKREGARADTLGAEWTVKVYATGE